jgi:hypothetical protein
MTSKISPREWEALSAYLDGQLSRKERSRLEESLQARSDLRAALEELRRTHVILHSQADMHAPRNFTLTPEMVGLKKSRPAYTPLYPALRLATVLATVLLVLVLAGDFLSGGREPPVFQMAARSSPANQEILAVPQAAAPQPSTGGAYPASTEAPSATQAAPALKSFEALPTPTAPPPALEMQAAIQAYPPPTETPPASLRSSQVITGTLSSASPAIPTIAPQADQTAGQNIAETTQAEAAVPGSGWATWRILELVFAILALVTGIVALTLRRAGRI